MKATPLMVYADGSCLGNPGPGGWGVVLLEGGEPVRELSGGEPQTTNNRMEITAAIQGLAATPEGSAVTVRTDSEYVVKTINLGWRRNANQDLWRSLDEQIARRKVKFEWVKGHADDRFNQRADQRALEAAKEAAGQRAKTNPSPTASPPPSDADAERQLAARLKPLLKPGESLRRCAGCGRGIVSTEDTLIVYCPHMTCQLKARSVPSSR